MTKEEFSVRLSKLRINKGISARDMSLSIGQSAGYINNIENGVNLPSMTVFFYICEYLGISPMEFFDTDSADPARLAELINTAKKLDTSQLEMLINLANEMRR